MNKTEKGIKKEALVLRLEHELIDDAETIVSHMAETFSNNWDKIDKSDVLVYEQTVERAVTEWTKKLAELKKARKA